SSWARAWRCWPRRSRSPATGRSRSACSSARWACRSWARSRCRTIGPRELLDRQRLPQLERADRLAEADLVLVDLQINLDQLLVHLIQLARVDGQAFGQLRAQRAGCGVLLQRLDVRARLLGGAAAVLLLVRQLLLVVVRLRQHLADLPRRLQLRRDHGIGALVAQVRLDRVVGQRL